MRAGVRWASVTGRPSRFARCCSLSAVLLHCSEPQHLARGVSGPARASALIGMPSFTVAAHGSKIIIDLLSEARQLGAASLCALAQDWVNQAGSLGPCAMRPDIVGGTRNRLIEAGLLHGERPSRPLIQWQGRHRRGLMGPVGCAPARKDAKDVAAALVLKSLA